MEKICTRCQFRNPPHRGVCQVCGYAKFQGVSTQAAVIAKQPTSSLSISMLLNQTLAAASAAMEKIAELHKQTDREKQKSDAPALTVVSEPTFESNDLDSMVAWFKAYGVDKPLILENKKTAA